jgi:hypothetical protein
MLKREYIIVTTKLKKTIYLFSRIDTLMARDESYYALFISNLEICAYLLYFSYSFQRT